ncbi:MmgE/PrpD family protein [Enterovirga aerilata]|uniref:MmgE/PrpD family protein n=1 Tax=Enterovirga aerilata TaxID=2730920 RepID=A0A849I5I9_9HYPH|nr:MmgE/PrpD family protein [Enterovirga sp. DB1703]NNM75126.1 MmgE/PrpD family protein [Enterovirga sp. DB1703]
MSAVPVARRLVRQFRSLVRQPLPAEVEEAAKLHLLDALGVGLAARASSVGRPYSRYAAGVALGGPATVLGSAMGAPASEAALVNGGLIHSLEYDDTHTGSIAHGSAVLAPTVLAAGEAAGAAGATVLKAFALGWETLIRMGLASAAGFQALGFQVTSVGGTLVAAMMAAELSGASEDEAVAAVGIALSGSSGGFEFLTNGSSVKSMHPGWAAHVGITAAAMARAGLTGPETAIEGRNGLFRAFAGDEKGGAAFGSLLEDFGTVWHLPKAAFKFYPCCHYLHPFIEAAGRLAEDGVAADEVDELVCRAPARTAAIICEPWALKQNPPSGHAARWSLPVAVAARLVDGRVDLAAFEAPASPAVLALAGRTRWEPLGRDNFPAAFEAEIFCRTRDGRIREVRIDDVFGNASRPATPEDVRGKFRANAGRTLPLEAVRMIEAAVDAIGAALSLGPLQEALRTEQPQPGRSAA